jgi:hypothetical protein
MENKESNDGLGKTIARGIAQHQASRVKERVENSTVDFRLEAGQKIEGLAEQIRLLGNRFESSDEAHLLARRLERLADYLRYRPSSEIAGDAWEAARRYRLLWITGGMFGVVLLYRLLRRSRNQIKEV